MAKYIDADKAIKHLKNALPHAEDTDEAERVIRSMPAADVQEVKHGRWDTDTMFFLICSVCGRQALGDDFGEQVESHYCPHCGAKMKGGTE